MCSSLSNRQEFHNHIASFMVTQVTQFQFSKALSVVDRRRVEICIESMFKTLECKL